MLIGKSHASSVLRSLFNLVLRTIEEIQASHYKNVHKTRHLKVGLQTWLLLFTQTQMKYNLNQILTLLWQLIMHYQVTEANQGSEILLLDWMNACLPEKDITNFSAPVSQQQDKKKQVKCLKSSLSQKGLKCLRSATLQALTLSNSCGPTKLSLALQLALKSWTQRFCHLESLFSSTWQPTAERETWKCIREKRSSTSLKNWQARRGVTSTSPSSPRMKGYSYW